MSEPLKPVKSQKAVSEMGHAAAGLTSAWWAASTADMEATPELQWPRSLAVYDRMRRSDPQVASVLRAVSHPVRRTPWRIDPNGAREEVVAHVAEDLGLPVMGQQSAPARRTRDRFSWDQHLQWALLMLPFGAMAFEQVYRIDESTGLARLRKLGPRMPHSISKWNVARDGGLVSIEQAATGGDVTGAPIVIPVSRLVAYVNEREGGNWHGRSMLRSAYGAWAIKERLMVVQAQQIERNGMGVPVYTNPPEGTQEQLDAGAQYAMAMRAGDNAGIGIPGGADMKLLGLSGQLADPLATIRYLDDAIASAVLAQVLQLSNGGKAGSYALGQTYADIFTQSLQAIAQNIADTATAHIVEDIVDLSYGPDEPAPKIVFDEIGGKAEAVAQAAKSLVDSGALTPDAGLESFLRSSLGLPARDESSAPAAMDTITTTEGSQ